MFLLISRYLPLLIPLRPISAIVCKFFEQRRATTVTNMHFFCTPCPWMICNIFIPLASAGWADEGGGTYRLTVVIDALDWSKMSDEPRHNSGASFTGHRILRPKDKKLRDKADKAAGVLGRLAAMTGAPGAAEHVAVQGWASAEGIWLQDQLGGFQLWGDMQPVTLINQTDFLLF